jgi:hypothetical protein
VRILVSDLPIFPLLTVLTIDDLVVLDGCGNKFVYAKLDRRKKGNVP